VRRLFKKNSAAANNTAKFPEAAMKDYWYEGNEIKLLINGEEFFPAVFESIRAARHQVLLETFIVSEDQIGIELKQALITAAQSGVQVEVMVDDYGTIDVSKSFLSEMIDAGVTILAFDPKPRTLGMRTNMFRRLHRKIVVVDGEIAYVGGINFSAEHIADFGEMAKQDYAVQVRGPIVNAIHRASAQLLLEASVKEKTKPRPDRFQPPQNQPVGDARVRIAVRDNNRHTSDIERLYLQGIRRAKKRIVIANAYFFPGYRLLRAMRNAARRGLEVTLILQGQPDMPWVSMCSRLLYSYLLKEGVIIHEYCKRPLHGKVALVDDDWTTIGSSNLDPLSLAMNLEANLFIEHRGFNQHLQELGKADCKPITLEHAKRGYWWRMPLITISFHFLRYFPAIVGWLPAHSPKLKPIRPEDFEEVNNKNEWKEKTSEQEKTV
jgi:cardiolipin synthase